MEYLTAALSRLTELVPTASVVVLFLALVFLIRWVLERRYGSTPGHGFRYQLLMLVMALIGLVVVILTLPVSEATTGQLLSLLGLLLSAAIALSATTFVGNIMAGLMLRSVRNFRGGDFIQVGDHFGRVSDRGLFHIEIQTVDSDLTTLPNLYLVTNPVKVIRSSGTLVTAEVSLGYDVDRPSARRALLAAAEDAGLGEPFVHVQDLGDFSVRYRIAGWLEDVKVLLSTRSKLREMMLDRLHGERIEIVSPTFMNQRVLESDRRFIPRPAREEAEEAGKSTPPEAAVFDKADEAESLEKLRQRLDELGAERDVLKSNIGKESDEAQKGKLMARLDQVSRSLTRLKEYIAEREQTDR